MKNCCVTGFNIISLYLLPKHLDIFFPQIKSKILLSEVGFEPTPAYADQNAHSSIDIRARNTLSLAP